MEKLSILCERLNDIIDAMIAEGHHQSGDEVVRDIAVLLEEREKRLAALRAAIEEGEVSGFGEPFDLEEFLVEMRSNRKEKSAAEQWAASRSLPKCAPTWDFESFGAALGRRPGGALHPRYLERIRENSGKSKTWPCLSRIPHGLLADARGITRDHLSHGG